MVKENWILDAAWKNRQSAKNAVRKNNVKMMLVPHPTLPKTWIEVESPKKQENEGDKYGLSKKDEEAEWETSEDILKEVADFCKMTIDEIQKKTRKREIVEARQVAMFLSTKRTHESLASIGRGIGMKDHATVLHSCKIVKGLWETSPEYRRKWGKLLT